MKSKNINCNRIGNLVVLTDKEVDEILTRSMARAGVLDGLACHATGDFHQPLKPYLYPKGSENAFSGGRFISMPAYAGPPVSMVGVKWIGSMPANVDRGLPRASGVLVLNDPVTALPLTVMECATLSARRTAAVAGLAIELLAPHCPLRIAVIGAGPIACEAVQTAAHFVDDIEVIRLCDLRLERAEHLQEIVRASTSAKVCVTSSAESCVRGANVVIAATTGAKGYLRLAWLSAPWLMIPLSLCDCEPGVLLAADKVICDDWDQSNREQKLLHQLTSAGQFSREDLYAEFGQIVTGRIHGREDQENVYCNFMGMGIEDVAVGARVFRCATADSA